MHVKNPKMFFVTCPELPALPPVSLDFLTETFHQSADTICEKNNVAIPNTVCTRHTVDKEIITWAKKNISTEFHTMGINCHGTPTGGVAIPHTDRSRNWVLMWIIDAGGDNVNTVFWQENGFDVERDPGYYPTSYRNLIELESQVFATNCWVLLNAKVIHSIENLQSVRKSVQISFWEDTDFIRKLTN